MPQHINYSICRAIFLPRRKVLEVTQEVTHTEAGARCFAGVRRSNALLGCSNAVIMQHKQKRVMLNNVELK